MIFDGMQFIAQFTVTMVPKKGRSSFSAKPLASEQVTEDDSSLAAWLDKGADVNAQNSE